MANELKTLAKCIKDANGNAAAITVCENNFKAAGGTVGQAEGGKVFSDPAGAKALITTGGKVFTPQA